MAREGACARATVAPPSRGNGHAAATLPEATGSSGNAFQLPSISAVIPTLDEARNLTLLLPELPPWIEEVIIVDGASSDGTVAVARRLCRDAKILIEHRRGKGAALRAGFAAATGEIIVVFDADCSMDPYESIGLVGALLSGADLAKGSRFLQGGGTDDMSSFRMYGNWCLTQVARVLFGGAFTDLCYGYFAFWSRHRDLLVPTCDGFEVEAFLWIRALQAGMTIFEVPSFEERRAHGVSNLRAVPDGWRVLKTLVRERAMAGRRGRLHAHLG